MGLPSEKELAMSPSVSHPEARRKRGLRRRPCGRVLAGAVLAGLAAIAGAQTTTAPSTPGTGAPSQPSAPHGGGVGVGIGIDLGGLIRGLQGKKDEPAASTPAQIQPPAGKVVASPQTVVAPGQSLASAAKTPAPPPNQFDEMQRSTAVFRGVTVDPADLRGSTLGPRP
jgi:hypothetical protein